MHTLRGGAGTLGTLAVVVMLAAAAPPALADTNLSTSGIVGVHSLVDSSSRPGVTCRYKVVDSADYSFATLLKSLTVRPPRMFAKVGTQNVAWRFTVLRQRWTDDGVGDKVTYSSPRQFATASRTRKATFAPMSVGVAVPRDGRSLNVLYDYSVRVEMSWYAADGSRSGSSTHLVDWYRTWIPDFPIGGPWVEEEKTPCEGWYPWTPN